MASNPYDVEDDPADVDEAPLQLGKKPQQDNEMDITPMIDITFLLLIFFLVASKMDPNDAVDLPKARHGDAVVAKNSVTIMVSKGSVEQAKVARGDGRLFSDDLEEQENEIKEYVETEMDKGDKEHILIKAEKGVKYREVNRVAKAVSLATEEGRPLHIAVMEVR